MKRFLLVVLLAMQAGLGAQAQTVQAVTEATSYSYLRDGKVSGPATEVVEATLQRAGLDYRLNLYPWARAYDQARNQPNVLIYMIARTPERELGFKWVGEFMKMQYHLYKLKERKDVVVSSLQDARSYSVGVVRDDLRHQYLKSRGFAKVVVSAHNIDNFRKLVSRQIQLIPLPENDALSLCQEAGVNCADLERVLTLDELTASLYMAYGMSTPDQVVERTRAAFQKLKVEGWVGRVMQGRP
ncbi:transporter substrate-binding domain-containing protein [Aquabacterium sp. A7-Y]|uniref:substrate-binding periplasmic protein n=1 Tax=Aquabacterium sp. A7-Y TaxID=1349605 RepID=UPI00223E6689|nr:transporter substrate-binding domain-containing protein [Aquabacterium sp. A7-Y]MCW7541711.1 transporter substrate-binding domain-containing protein [Aquabacterium sp. A7-Y]